MLCGYLLRFASMQSSVHQLTAVVPLSIYLFGKKCITAKMYKLPPLSSIHFRFSPFTLSGCI